ncbi:MAG: hypothetical protein ABIV10_06530 [Gemmatimonadaceae bacterium]
MPPVARSIVAVVVGFLVIGMLAIGTDAIVKATVPGVFGPDDRVDSVPWLLIIQLYVFVYAAFGCWLAARMAPNRPMRHALILGALGLVFNIVGTIALWDKMPAWYHIVAIALVMPAAWVGARIRERQMASVSRSSALGTPTPA